jgi:FkbM family methyltransferase
MKAIFLFLSRNRRNPIINFLRKCSLFVYYAIDNKNNDHYTNGEFWLMQRLQRINPLVIFDAGANVGKWSTEANKLFKDADIHSFEPVPDIFEKLSRNTANLPKVHLYNTALSNSAGTLTFHFYPNSPLFNSIYNHPSGREVVSVQCPALPGSDFCEQHNISNIDFLKIDVEGAEHLVLEGFREMIQNKKIRAIQFEYGIFSIETKFLLKDYYEFFDEHSYIVGKIYPNYVDFRAYAWDHETFWGPNYLAIRSDDLELMKILS